MIYLFVSQKLLLEEDLPEAEKCLELAINSSLAKQKVMHFLFPSFLIIPFETFFHYFIRHLQYYCIAYCL